MSHFDTGESTYFCFLPPLIRLTFPFYENPMYIRMNFIG